MPERNGKIRVLGGHARWCGHTTWQPGQGWQFELYNFFRTQIITRVCYTALILNESIAKLHLALKQKTTTLHR